VPYATWHVYLVQAQDEDEAHTEEVEGRHPDENLIFAYGMLNYL
jgi:hypothetical protein